MRSRVYHLEPGLRSAPSARAHIVPKVAGEGATLTEIREKLKANFDINVPENEISKILEEIERRSG